MKDAGSDNFFKYLLRERGMFHFIYKYFHSLHKGRSYFLIRLQEKVLYVRVDFSCYCIVPSCNIEDKK